MSVQSYIKIKRAKDTGKWLIVWFDIINEQAIRNETKTYYASNIADAVKTAIYMANTSKVNLRSGKPQQTSK